MSQAGERLWALFGQLCGKRLVVGIAGFIMSSNIHRDHGVVTDNELKTDSVVNS